MTTRITKMNNLFMLLLCILLMAVINNNSYEIFAEDADSALLVDIPLEGKNTPDKSSALAEEFSTETIWFGFAEEVAIATRHETTISKAPGIVTVITAEEISNLGYRTFVEILRTVPGFEILKDGSTGVVVPAVRGITSSTKVRVMLNGHLV